MVEFKAEKHILTNDNGLVVINVSDLDGGRLVKKINQSVGSIIIYPSLWRVCVARVS